MVSVWQFVTCSMWIKNKWGRVHHSVGVLESNWDLLAIGMLVPLHWLQCVDSPAEKENIGEFSFSVLKSKSKPTIGPLCTPYESLGEQRFPSWHPQDLGFSTSNHSLFCFVCLCFLLFAKAVIFYNTRQHKLESSMKREAKKECDARAFRIQNPPCSDVSSSSCHS
jgi:hypothetical protein